MDEDNTQTLRRLGHIEEVLLEIEDRLYELNTSLTGLVLILGNMRATQLKLEALASVDAYKGEPPA